MNSKEINQEIQAQKKCNQKQIFKEAIKKALHYFDKQELKEFSELDVKLNNLDENQLKEYQRLNEKMKRSYGRWKGLIEVGWPTHPTEKIRNEKGKNKEKQFAMKYHLKE